MDRHERHGRRDVHRLQVRRLGALVSVRKHSRLRRQDRRLLGASNAKQVDRQGRQQTQCKQFEGISNEVKNFGIGQGICHGLNMKCFSYFLMFIIKDIIKVKLYGTYQNGKK